VHFIENSAGERMIEGAIALPVITAEICDDAFRGGSRVVPGSSGNTTLILARGDRLGIWIEK
jgi:hypothetical protein